MDCQNSARAEKGDAENAIKSLRKQALETGIIELRAGRNKPHRKTQELLVGVLKKLHPI